MGWRTPRAEIDPGLFTVRAATRSMRTGHAAQESGVRASPQRSGQASGSGHHSYCDLACPVCHPHLLADRAFMLGGEETSSWVVRPHTRRMPTRSKQREDFFAAHPWCAFCGGVSKATTVEHCPPKALFQFNRWPESFEFPACKACNSGTGDHDAIVALLARADPNDRQGNADGRFEGLLRNVNAQFPGVVSKMIPSATEARRRNRALGLKPGPGQIHQDIAPVSIPLEFNAAVATFALKLSKAIYYRETGAAFPQSGTVIMSWFTNVALVRTGAYPVFQHLQMLGATTPPFVRNRKALNDQFEYRVSLSADRALLLAQVRVGQAFGMIVCASVTPGVLESAIASLQAKHRTDGPFVTLQSPDVA